MRLMTRLGNTLGISSNPMSLIMLYLKSLDSSIDSLQSVRVVREYPDILGEVKGVTPKREIDFCIYLVNNAKIVSWPVRHMAPQDES